MARLVKKTAHEPMEINVGGESKWICMCGLSKDQPFCDGSHHRAKDEDPKKTYVYDNEKRVEV